MQTVISFLYASLTSVYMVSRYTRFLVLLPDNTSLSHSNNPSDCKGLASVSARTRVLYGFRIARTTLFLTGYPQGS